MRDLLGRRSKRIPMARAAVAALIAAFAGARARRGGRPYRPAPVRRAVVQLCADLPAGGLRELSRCHQTRCRRVHSRALRDAEDGVRDVPRGDPHLHLAHRPPARAHPQLRRLPVAVRHLLWHPLPEVVTARRANPGPGARQMNGLELSLAADFPCRRELAG